MCYAEIIESDWRSSSGFPDISVNGLDFPFFNKHLRRIKQLNVFSSRLLRAPATVLENPQTRHIPFSRSDINFQSLNYLSGENAFLTEMNPLFMSISLSFKYLGRLSAATE